MTATRTLTPAQTNGLDSVDRGLAYIQHTRLSGMTVATLRSLRAAGLVELGPVDGFRQMIIRTAA